MNSENSNLKSAVEAIENLQQTRESLSSVEQTFHKDSRQFQNETLKALTQMAMEVQALRERVTEVAKVVQGSDNPDALHVQFRLLKQQTQYLETEIKEQGSELESAIAALRSQIENHTQFHSKVVSTTEDRGWQLKLAIFTAILGLAGAAIAGLTPLAQKALTPTPHAEENPWFQD